MKEILGRFFAFLLIGLLLVKISAFHVYEHHDSQDGSTSHCELCLLAIEGQQSEGLITSIFIVQESSTPELSELNIIFSGPTYINSNIPIILFSRPPPAITV